VKRLVQAGRIRPDERVVCVITGSGLKQPSAIQQAVPASDLRLNASYAELAELVGRIWGECPERNRQPDRGQRPR
jgi:threonine synthase